MSEQEPWMPTFDEMLEMATKIRSFKNALEPLEALIRRAAAKRALEMVEQIHTACESQAPECRYEVDRTVIDRRISALKRELETTT